MPENEPKNSSDHIRLNPWKAENMWMCRQVCGPMAWWLLGVCGFLSQFILFDFHVNVSVRPSSIPLSRGRKSPSCKQTVLLSLASSPGPHRLS